ncbi:hypothetical protein ACFIPR_003208 [Enterobacter kobei]
MATKKTTTTDGMKVKLDGTIYVGETILLDYPKDSTVKIITTDGKELIYQYPYSDIDTTDWVEGMYTALIKESKTQSVKLFQVEDPHNITKTYNMLVKIINEIDLVVDARLSGGGVLSTTINNKTLLNESLASLYKLRAGYVKRANAELGKINGSNQGNPIKSYTNFSRGYNV